VVIDICLVWGWGQCTFWKKRRCSRVKVGKPMPSAVSDAPVKSTGPTAAAATEGVASTH